MGQDRLAVDQANAGFDAAGLGAKIFDVNCADVTGGEDRPQHVGGVPCGEFGDIDLGGVDGFVFALIEEADVGLDKIIDLAGRDGGGKVVNQTAPGNHGVIAHQDD